MKLTPRQRTFLVKLSELYQEHQAPVHYSLVAEKLGVNKFSAYDMLKVLEQKSLVASDYVLDSEHPGPGRSTIVFYPTRKANRLLIHWTGEIRLGEEWQQIQERILQRLREAGETDYREILNEALARIPESRSPLVYCAEMIAALLLNLNSVASEIHPFKALIALGSTGEVGLGTLAGLSLGSTFSKKADAPAVHKLLDYTKKYQSYLLNLSEESKAVLSEFLQEALVIFERAP
jgi:hypothetical protein